MLCIVGKLPGDVEAEITGLNNDSLSRNLLPNGEKKSKVQQKARDVRNPSAGA